MPFELPALPYDKTAFGDLISAETFDYHHGKHHNAYISKANAMIANDESLQGKSLVDIIQSSDGGLFNQVGQIWNHSFYWLCLSPEKKEPAGRLAQLINDQFGSLDHLIDALKSEATGHFGSGWAAMNVDGEQLTVTSYHDADCPLAHDHKPLLILDVWEHAYYVDYRNARGDYADAILRNAIDWDFVASNLDGQGAERANQG